MICRNCNALMKFVGLEDSGCNDNNGSSELYECPECGHQYCHELPTAPDDEDHDYTDEEPN